MAVSKDLEWEEAVIKKLRRIFPTCTGDSLVGQLVGTQPIVSLKLLSSGMPENLNQTFSQMQGHYPKGAILNYPQSEGQEDPVVVMPLSEFLKMMGKIL